MNDRIANLQAAVNAGRARGEFPESLLRQYAQRGSLSEKQWLWVDKLANQQPRAAIELPAFTGVLDLFARAREHLKYPKIRLQLSDGSPLVLGVAGPNSREPGSINLTDGGPYGANVFYGRVSPAGAATLSNRVQDEKREEIAAILARLASEPAKVAAEYGKLTGNCSFCNKSLTDERSTAVGYGPVCAKKFALPWA
jgi:hypothetical protein